MMENSYRWLLEIRVWWIGEDGKQREWERRENNWVTYLEFAKETVIYVITFSVHIAIQLIQIHII